MVSVWMRIESHWHLGLGLKTTCVSNFAYYNLSATINITKIDQISDRTNAEINCIVNQYSVIR